MRNYGVYLLWLYLPKKTSLTVGRLGTFSCSQGVYAYAGSAQRNLQQRLDRHRRLEKKLRWHIDYFRRAAQFLGVTVFLGAPKDGECRLAARLLSLPGAVLPIKGFGASDCLCASHLVLLPDSKPDLVALGNAVHDVELGAAETFTLFDTGD